jgi:hypothetical protein
MMAERSLLADAAKGALAGAVATWVMGQVTTYMYEHEDEEARQREDAARSGTPAFTAAAEKGAELAGVDAVEATLQKAGSALHWGLGIGAGAVYAVMRGRWLGSDWKSALEFGGGFFLLVDELANPLFGWTPGPRAFPWQAHARGLAGHTVFGVAAEATLRVLDRVR